MQGHSDLDSILQGGNLLKAVTYQGIKRVEVKEVLDPKFEESDDIIVRITSKSICGLDLHPIHGMVQNLQQDYIIDSEICLDERCKMGQDPIIYLWKEADCVKVVLKP
jgi:hypothetical protein